MFEDRESRDVLEPLADGLSDKLLEFCSELQELVVGWE
jgi:hypothetical protein